MNAFSFLRGEMLIWLVFSGILLSAIGLFLFWFLPPLRRLGAALSETLAALGPAGEPWTLDRSTTVRQVVATHPELRQAWQETEQRIIAVPVSGRLRVLMLGSPRDLWTPNRLLAGRLNVELAEAVPNLLVGVGLFFTFLFLTGALMGATSALSQQGGASADLLDATRGLLDTAGGKFLTSLAGLGASVGWTVAARRAMARVQDRCELLLEALAERLPPNGTELALVEQLRQGEAVNTRLDAGHARAGELLTVAREQRQLFVQFRDQVAEHLGRSISASIVPEMEAMSRRIVASLDGLTGQISAMNQQALEQMMRDHAGLIQQSTRHEMGELRAALTLMSERLQASAGTLVNGADDVAGVLRGAGQDLQMQLTAASRAWSDSAQATSNAFGSSIATSVDALGRAGTTLGSTMEQAVASFSQSAAQATQSLQQAGSELESGVTRIGGVLCRGAEDLDAAQHKLATSAVAMRDVLADMSSQGRQGADQIRAVAQQLRDTLAQLDQVQPRWAGTTDRLGQIAEEIGRALASVETLARQQQTLVETVGQSAPQALEAVRQVGTMLEQSGRDTAAAMQSGRDALTGSSAVLAAAVESVRSSIEQGAAQALAQQQQLDGHLARAVGQIGGAVRELATFTRSLEDLLEERVAAV